MLFLKKAAAGAQAPALIPYSGSLPEKTVIQNLVFFSSNPLIRIISGSQSVSIQ